VFFMKSIPIRQRRRRQGLAAAAIVATAILVLVAAACSSSPSSTGSGSPNARGSASSPSAVAYSACIRSHGVPNFPDPDSSGNLPKADPQQLGVSTSQLQAAQQPCQHQLPSTGSTEEQQQETQCAMAGDCSQSLVQHWLSGLRTLAQCLRSHGVPNWPDPTINSRGLPQFAYSEAGIDDHSPQILAKVQVCVRRTGFEGLPLPSKLPS
jgi:hypothetical protein